MNMPMISVVMANYNTEIPQLGEAIESILQQTISDFELIIVDDNSNNGSYEYIQSIYDHRIILIKNNRNCGPAISRNKALDVARGQYIAIMDSDDIALPTRFEEQLRFMEDNEDVIACGTWFEKFGDESKIRKPVLDDFEYYRCQLLFDNYPITICHPSSMLRKATIDRYCIRYDEGLPKAQDYGMWVTCSKYGRIAIIPKVLLRYRIHKKQISTAHKESQKNYADQVCKKQLKELDIMWQDEISWWRLGRVKSVSDAIMMWNWLSKIINANETRGQYDNDKLFRYSKSLAKRAIQKMRASRRIPLFLRADWSMKKIIIESFLC